VATLMMETAKDRAPVEAAPALGADLPAHSAHQHPLEALIRDLKGPLTLIDARAQLLERRLDRPEAVDSAAIRAGLAQIRAASARMDVLLHELAEAAPPDGGVCPVPPRP
jgi:hypothetical protein